MQELEETILAMINNGGDADLFPVLVHIKKLLEKEKEQIMNAYCDGAKGGANGNKGPHEFGWVSRYTRKKYYNQNYNQNK